MASCPSCFTVGIERCSRFASATGPIAAAPATCGSCLECYLLLLHYLHGSNVPGSRYHLQAREMEVEPRRLLRFRFRFAYFII